MVNPFFPRPNVHFEEDPRIERYIVLASRMLSRGAEEPDVLAELMVNGAEEFEAVHAMKAGEILNRGLDSDESPATVPNARRRH